MNDAPPQASLQKLADEDLARRSQATAFSYLALYLIVVIFSPYLHEHLSTALLAGSVLLTAAAARTYLLLKFDTLYQLKPDSWRRGFIATTLILGGSWGLFCAHSVIHYELEWTTMLMLLGTAGISAGAITTLSLHRGLILVFLALLLLPPAAASAFLQTRAAYAVSLMVLTYSGFMFALAMRLNKEYWHALHNTLLLDQRARELEASNQELESYSYSIAHDLRTPLRSIIGFSQILLEKTDGEFSAADKRDLERIINAGKNMAQLIDDILELSRITRKSLTNFETDLSGLAEIYARQLARQDPQRSVTVRIQPGLLVRGDPKLLNVALQNLISNAWKFTSKKDGAEIELSATTRNGETVYCVRDNGAGFDMNYAEKLFRPFARLHNDTEFPGTGVGLATVQRIILRHGGRIWAEGEPGKGARFYFVLT